MRTYSTAEAFIDIANAHGIDKIFFNPGGEIIGLQSLIAQARVAGKKAPQLLLCLDESVAVSAAHGNYMVSGKPQVILVHSELGTLQMGGNLQNLQWGRVPVVIMAAYQADEQRTTWKQEPYDQGGIVRGNMKWDRYITNDEDIHEILTEAFRVACTRSHRAGLPVFPHGLLRADGRQNCHTAGSRLRSRRFRRPMSMLLVEPRTCYSKPRTRSS